MSALAKAEFDAASHALSHMQVFHRDAYLSVTYMMESIMLTVAAGNLIDPVAAAAETVRELQAKADEVCGCPPDLR